LKRKTVCSQQRPSFKLNEATHPVILQNTQESLNCWYILSLNMKAVDLYMFSLSAVDNDFLG